MTVVAAWHHGEIPSLVKELLGQEKEKLDALGWLSKWPHTCGSDSRWAEPGYLPNSDQCYDLLWRITLLREMHKAELPHRLTLPLPLALTPTLALALALALALTLALALALALARSSSASVALRVSARPRHSRRRPEPNPNLTLTLTQPQH